MISIFTDLTERSPTFGLSPIDTVNEVARKSWITMFTDAKDRDSAWIRFLGRPFRGLNPDVFIPAFETVADKDLRERALTSLSRAGNEQSTLYDFSIANENLVRGNFGKGDLCMIALLPHELDGFSVSNTFLKYSLSSEASIIVVTFFYTEASIEKLRAELDSERISLVAI